MPVCIKCKINKPVTSFYHNRRMESGLDYYCKTCRNKQTVENVKQHKGRYINHGKSFVESLKTPCVKCGENRMYLIQFHHVDPTTKLFLVSAPSGHSRSEIVTEASKCVCLCSNCHDEFHYFFGRNPVDPVGDFDKYLDEDY